MKMSLKPALGLCIVAASWMIGCGALSSAGAPGDARFFRIDPVSGRPADARASAAAADLPGLQLGRITGALHLEERAVRRESANEVGYYREIRWTEAPERFLERLLTYVLFEELGMERRMGGTGATLDVHLVALDVVSEPRRLARAQAVASLRDGGRVIWGETLTVETLIVEIEGGDPVLETVDALAEALRGLADRIANRAIRLEPVQP
jgi:ABC-type uncharacterized transport system auxiliary subunit